MASWARIGVCACVVTSCAGSGAGSASAVDSVFSDIAADGPGAVVGVRYGGEVVHTAGYGLANLEHDVSMSPETVFDIASISKQFGAMAALLLEADGNLDLDADVRTLVPELPDFGHVITPRHLVHHTSGIRDWPHTMAIGGVEMSDVISFEKILRMLFQQRDLNFPPGEEYAYSNTGYNLLALSIERASGERFRAFTNRRIFEPLGMTRTHFSDDYNEIVPGRAQSYAPLADGPEGRFERRTNQLTALASSSLHTTMNDFLRWMENYETGQVGGADLIARMTDRGTLNSDDRIPYAYGVVTGRYRELEMFRHGGSWAGFRTEFIRFPEQNLSVAVFCNFSTCNPGRRARAVAEVYLEEHMGPGGTFTPPDNDLDRPTLSASQLREYEGDYRSEELDTSYRIRVVDGELVAEHWRNQPAVLLPTDPDIFSGDQWWFPEVAFLRDRNGRITGMTVTGARVRELRFDRR